MTEMMKKGVKQAWLNFTAPSHGMFFKVMIIEVRMLEILGGEEALWVESCVYNKFSK